MAMTVSLFLSTVEGQELLVLLVGGLFIYPRSGQLTKSQSGKLK